MRRNAKHALPRFFPASCALLAVVLVVAIGKADIRTPAPLIESPRFVYHWPAQVKEQIFEALPNAHSLLMEVTAYCPCPKCCGKGAHGVTASGRHVTHNNGRFVAADTSILPFGTKLVIPGYVDAPVEVLDRGGAIKGNKLDVFFPTHEEAKQWGRRWVEVIVSPAV